MSETKSKTVSVRLTAKDFNKLKRKAASKGMKIEEYIEIYISKHSKRTKIKTEEK